VEPAAATGLDLTSDEDGVASVRVPRGFHGPAGAGPRGGVVSAGDGCGSLDWDLAGTVKCCARPDVLCQRWAARNRRRVRPWMLMYAPRC
jgi:hypothetical protein